MKKPTLYLIGSEEEYLDYTARYETVKNAVKGTAAHKEKMLLVHLISTYEEQQWDIAEINPIELIKIRMKEFGYKPADLATAYGDKGTISKVLNYKQSLSLSMIRKFSKMLRIPSQLLIKEYDLKDS